MMKAQDLTPPSLYRIWTGSCAGGTDQDFRSASVKGGIKCKLLILNGLLEEEHRSPEVTQQPAEKRHDLRGTDVP